MIDRLVVDYIMERVYNQEDVPRSINMLLSNGYVVSSISVCNDKDHDEYTCISAVGFAPKIEFQEVFIVTKELNNSVIRMVNPIPGVLHFSDFIVYPDNTGVFISLWVNINNHTRREKWCVTMDGEFHCITGEVFNSREARSAFLALLSKVEVD